LRLLRATIRLLRERKPEVVYFQNPSLLLGMLLAAMRQVGAYRGSLVADYHNAGVWPPLGSFGRAATRWIARQSDLVIVTNIALAREIESWGARPAVVPDPIPCINVPTQSGDEQPRRPFEVLFI